MPSRDLIMASAGAASPPSVVASASTVDDATGTTITCNVPTGTATGDLMVAYLVGSSGSTTWTAPSGWTKVSGDYASSMMYKVAASEGSSVTFTASNSSSKNAAIITFRNAKWGGFSNYAIANSGAIVTPAAVYVENTGFVLAAYHGQTASVTFSTPSGATSQVSDSSATAPSFALFTKAITADGSSGSISSDPSGSDTNYGMAACILPSSSTTGGGEITLRSTAQARTTTNGSTLTISKPTGTAEGDFMLAVMCVSANGNFWSGDTGWTEVADEGAPPGLRIAYKVAGASEPSNYTFTFGVSTQLLAGGILSYQNAAYSAVGSFDTPQATTTFSAITPDKNAYALLLVAATRFGSSIDYAPFTFNTSTDAQIDGTQVDSAPGFWVARRAGGVIQYNVSQSGLNVTANEGLSDSAGVLLLLKPKA